MKNSHKGAYSIMKINFRQLLLAYLVMAVFVAVGIYNLIACLTGLTDNTYVDMVNYLYVFSVIAPIMIVTRNFNRIMHLNGNKREFYLGTFLNYCVAAAVISLLNILFLVVTEAVFGSRLVILNLVEVFGWWKHGAIVAFIQQFFFLLLAQVFFHTLASVQNRWYGWLTDGVLAIVLCVFIPVPELHKLLISFFDMIIFHSSAIMQIVCCFVLSTALYLLYWLILQRKEI